MSARVFVRVCECVRRWQGSTRVQRRAAGSGRSTLRCWPAAAAAARCWCRRRCCRASAAPGPVQGLRSWRAAPSIVRHAACCMLHPAFLPPMSLLQQLGGRAALLALAPVHARSDCSSWLPCCASPIRAPSCSMLLLPAAAAAAAAADAAPPSQLPRPALPPARLSVRAWLPHTPAMAAASMRQATAHAAPLAANQ